MQPIPSFFRLPLIVVDGMSIRPFDEHSFYIQKDCGEGMQISKAKFSEWLLKIYEEEF